ncbi:UDP-glucose 4-epimerase GalE [Magnetospira sp. QH-2]|uniref:UDP-glucose 4-epimerase GalE n=1 Tax=Magnetospira sp. (strain QH-2) TaxID=1288970 RepID=UPI0003E81276|nr:UDP-glucose 4-epimerase GalE [Magnetospira sp. QH-2]CCQ75462.1 UDP-glucose 4-epimerase [Magnetospira sp. QH-2]
MIKQVSPNDQSKQAVLVTGGAGYIGSHVCKALSQEGYQPIVYDNLCRGFQWAVKWGPLIVGNLADHDSLCRTIVEHAPVGVIHLAGYAYVGESVEQPDLYHQNNVVGTEVLLSALAQSAGAASPMVFSSTCSIYGDQVTTGLSEDLPPNPMNPYAKGKLQIENMLIDAERNSGAPFVALRYFNASGADPSTEIGEAHDPETHLIPLVLEVAAGMREEIVVFGTDYGTPDGSCVRDYVHVTDLAAAHVSALRYLLDGGRSGVMNLAHGSGYSVLEVIAAVERVTGKEVRYRKGARRPGDPATLVGDATLAKKTLDWKPRYSDLDTQIDHAWAWFRSYHKIPGDP